MSAVVNAWDTFLGLYIKAVSIWLGVLFVAFCVGSGCARQASPLEEMFAANARGEVACVRDGLLKRGRESCK